MSLDPEDARFAMELERTIADQSASEIEVIPAERLRLVRDRINAETVGRRIPVVTPNPHVLAAAEMQVNSAAETSRPQDATPVQHGQRVAARQATSAAETSRPQDATPVQHQQRVAARLANSAETSSSQQGPRPVHPALELAIDARPRIVLCASACEGIRHGRLIEMARRLTALGNQVVIVVTDTAKKFLNIPQFQSTCKLFTNSDGWFYSDTFGIQLYAELINWSTKLIVFCTANTLAKIALNFDHRLLTKLVINAATKSYLVPDMTEAEWDSLAMINHVINLQASRFRVRDMTPLRPTVDDLLRWSMF